MIGQNTSQSGPSSHLVTFSLGSERFGVDILSVREINRMLAITRVPDAGPELAGVTNLRGTIIPVLDLRVRLGMDPAARTDSTRIVVVENATKAIGLLVDRVHDVIRIASDGITPPPPVAPEYGPGVVVGVARVGESLIVVLSLESLLAGAPEPAGA